MIKAFCQLLRMLISLSNAAERPIKWCVGVRLDLCEDKDEKPREQKNYSAGSNNLLRYCQV